MESKNIINLIFAILVVITLTRCIRVFQVTDNYFVHSANEFGNGYYLFCNPSCEYDAFIENLKSIKWDKKHIIVEQQENGKTNWYMIIAKGEKLMCCNSDTIIKAVSQIEMDSLIRVKNVNVNKMKKKSWPAQNVVKSKKED